MDTVKSLLSTPVALHLTKLFDRIKSLYEKGESYETKPFLHFKVLEDDIESSPNGVFTAKEVAEFLGI